MYIRSGFSVSFSLIAIVNGGEDKKNWQLKEVIRLYRK